MKHGLLISVAAVALVAGAQVASSQSTGPNVPGGPSAPAAQSPGPSTAPSAPTGRTPDMQATPDTQSPGMNKGDRGKRQGDRATEQSPGKNTPQQRSTEPAPDKAGPPQRSTEQAPGKDAPQPRQTDRDTKGFPDQKQQTQGAPQPGTKQGDRGMTSRSVSLTTEQRTTIRNTVIKTGPRVSTVNFDIRVGVVVPRTVRVAPLPATIIEIQPDWRGYMYFVYEDEIIVVEPGTLRIVAVLEV